MSMPMPMPMPTPASSNDTMNMQNMVMQMSFFWGKNVTVLFKDWPDNHLWMYILALSFVFLIALAVEVLSVSPTIRAAKTPFLGGLIQSSINTVRIALGYLVMLSVMSFNIGIFIAAVAGHFCGYFIVKFRQLVADSHSGPSTNLSTNKV
ncbi:hypothetical protein Leryth_020480 [Lithospermum erythrorhizon]|nr:hypothetical protein Leryth_020480 [Lithospermum erythrorhizon]